MRELGMNPCQPMTAVQDTARCAPCVPASHQQTAPCTTSCAVCCAGTGYSIPASDRDIPEDMTGMAQDLYEGIWKFFDAHQDLQQRPFIIAGESYAGGLGILVAHTANMLGS